MGSFGCCLLLGGLAFLDNCVFCLEFQSILVFLSLTSLTAQFPFKKKNPCVLISQILLLVIMKTFFSKSDLAVNYDL